MEVERNAFASKALGGSALGLGIAGTALGVMNGGLGNILGGGWNMGACNNGYAMCSENIPVNRYELGMEREITNKDMEIAYLRGRDASKNDDLEMYKYIDSQLKDVRDTLCAQAVHNQKTEDSFVLARQDICAVESRLNGKIAMEAERRCCGDNAIVNYVNATFYPKQVSDVSVAATQTAQTLYNPIPDCGCCCDK
jgi:hypothetical protein